MSSSRPTSVRGLYAPPAEEWVFLPPTVSPPSNAPAAPSPPSHLPASSAFPSLPDDSVTTVYGPLQLFAAEYFTTALGMPFEVGKTLLQIEYRPRKRYDFEESVSEKVPVVDNDDLEDAEDADMYFTDRLATSQPTLIPPPLSTNADTGGYLPDLPSTWRLRPDPTATGVWGMMRRLRQTPSEGLPALWKTQLITTLHSLVTNLLQPHVHSLLLIAAPEAPAMDVPLTALPNPGLGLGLQVASHLLTHLLLSPLELVRTRLIALSSSHHSTPSSVAMFRQVVEEEGGFSSLYFNPNILIPSILEHTLRPFLTLSTSLILSHHLHISPEYSPLTYSMCDLALGLGSLTILLPIETVRKRLQLQSRAPSGKRRSEKWIVRTREREYVGVVEGIWRIMTEETSRSGGEDGGLFMGVRQLYRGFGMAVTAHLTVFGLGLVSAGLGGRSFESQWKEI